MLANTFNGYFENAKNLAPYLQGKRLGEIKAIDLEGFKADRLEMGRKPATVNRDIAFAKTAFGKALEWGWIGENRIKTVKFLREDNVRLRYLEKWERNALLSACSGQLKMIVEFVMNTGLRRSEVLGMKWKDVDIARGFAIVRNTKNHEDRAVPLNDRAKEILSSVPRHLRNESVFVSPIEEGKSRACIKRAFEKAVKDAGLNDFTFHDLRHDFASSLVMAGEDILTVQKLLGHKTMKMTLRYAHLSSDYQKRAVDALQRFHEKTTGHNLVTNSKNEKRVT